MISHPDFLTPIDLNARDLNSKRPGGYTSDCWSQQRRGSLRRITAAVLRLTLSAIASVFLGSNFAPLFAQETDNRLLTIAESSQFTATATGEQVEQFLHALSTQSDRARIIDLGMTVEGRSIHCLAIEPLSVSKKDGSSSATVRPLNVLVLANIHPGECDGKEASLALARDLTRGVPFDQLESNPDAGYESLRILLVPNFNADGDARRGPHHRPGQAGPDSGMGIRENAQGLDLNRDFVKLESPEVQNLVAAINQFEVDVLIDLHTTNGSLHRYDLTYDLPHHPATSPILDQFLRNDLFPNVESAMREVGFETFYYGNFDDRHQRWESFGYQPRYSTEYMGLRGRIGILVESYSYAPYKKRIEASYHFVEKVLERLNSDAGRVRGYFDEFDKTNTPAAKVAVAGKLTKIQETVTVLGYQDSDGRPPVAPFGPESRSQYLAHDYEVELWNRGQPLVEVELPAAYAVAPQYAWAISKVLLHGVEVFRLTKNESLPVDVAKIISVDSLAPYEGHSLQTTKVDWKEASRELSAGTYIIPTSGPLGRLVATLLEPESDDSLATWNFLDPYLKVGSDFPVLRLNTMPSSVEAVQQVEPGERLSLPLAMEPQSSIDYSGGNRIESLQWLKNSNPPEVVFRRDGQWYACEASSGATRRISQQRQLEEKLQALDEFSKAEAKSAAARSRFWREGLERELLRHKGDLFLYDTLTQSARRLTNSPDAAKELAEMNPTGTHVAFIRDNDLWILDCQSAEEQRITQDGSENLLNGKLDWVYQEELYGRGNFKGFWWSPDGRFIAYLQLNQSQVPEFMVLDSIPVGQSVERIRYPKAGQPNPEVKAFVVEVSTGIKKEIDLNQWSSNDRLIGRVSWSPDNKVYLQIFNRVQNVQDLVQVDPSSLSKRTVLNESSTGWIEIRGTPEFFSDQQFLWLSDVPDGRTRLYRVDVDSGLRSQLTHGDWDVAELLKVSPDGTTAFVSGNLGSSIESHLVSVNIQSGEMKKITQQSGTHEISVDDSGQYFLDDFSSIDNLPQTTLHDMDNHRLRVLSAPTNDRFKYAEIQPPKLLTIRARDGLELQAMVLLPWAVDDSATSGVNRLPVLFHVYSGPQAPVVKNTWQQRNYWWHQSLCSKGYAVVLCDNRSSLGRGVADTWKIRGDMGRIELQDLEDCVDWVCQQPWADSGRIGLWGWSYGGYMTAYALTHSKKFRVGIAGAPVTDWKNYDSIYTERYMDLPETNVEGYQSSSVVRAAGDLHGRLLLIHGERDDNVHLSNSLQLAAALQAEGKQFDIMIYPKARHSVIEPNKRYQMYQMMTDFLERHLRN